MVAALVATLVLLQGRFDQSDVKKGIGIALQHRAEPGGPTVFDALVKLGQGDPLCDGKVVSIPTALGLISRSRKRIERDGGCEAAETDRWT